MFNLQAIFWQFLYSHLKDHQKITQKFKTDRLPNLRTRKRNPSQRKRMSSSNGALPSTEHSQTGGRLSSQNSFAIALERMFSWRTGLDRWAWNELYHSCLVNKTATYWNIILALYLFIYIAIRLSFIQRLQIETFNIANPHLEYIFVFWRLRAGLYCISYTSPIILGWNAEILMSWDDSKEIVCIFCDWEFLWKLSRNVFVLWQITNCYHAS